MKESERGPAADRTNILTGAKGGELLPTTFQEGSGFGLGACNWMKTYNIKTKIKTLIEKIMRKRAATALPGMWRILLRRHNNARWKCGS